MAKEATAHTAATAEAPKKAPRERKPAEPKTVYAVVQVIGENGEPRTDLAKSEVRVISFEKSAEKVLELVESGTHPGAVFLRGKLPPGR